MLLGILCYQSTNDRHLGLYFSDTISDALKDISSTFLCGQLLPTELKDISSTFLSSIRTKIDFVITVSQSGEITKIKNRW